MGPVPVSAYEAYQHSKKKKSSVSKKRKDSKIKSNILLLSEMKKIAKEKCSSGTVTLGKKETNSTSKLVGGGKNQHHQHEKPRVEAGTKKQPHQHGKSGVKAGKKKQPHQHEKPGVIFTGKKAVPNSVDVTKTDKLVKKHSGPLSSPQKPFSCDHALPLNTNDENSDVIETLANVACKRKKIKKSKLKFPFNNGEAANNDASKNDNVNTYQEKVIPQILNSVETAENVFTWMISPIQKQLFFSEYWEKRPVHISRENHRDYYSAILSSHTIDKILRSKNLFFGKNVDITSYTDGERKTHNPAGRAQAGVVWDFYRHGCSVRLLNPQTYIPELCELNSILQELFGSFVGANLYLTPPNSQGFAPHYDDIEAFVLQIEGCKFWRVYAPRHGNETLPRTSSSNFVQEEIGQPILEVLLKQGDMLYFPRGFIHQAYTVPGHHSLHVTVSTYQRNSWADLLEKLVPAALACAVEENEEFRKGMPLDVLDHLGVVHSESDSPQRRHIIAKIQTLFAKLFDHAPIDAAADQLGKEFQHDALPPRLTSEEKSCSVFENSDEMQGNGKLCGTAPLTSGTRIRLTRSKVLRLVSEEEPDTLKLYHCMDNSLSYHEDPPQFIEIPVSMGPAVEFLLASYPQFVPIADLPLDDAKEKVQIAVELWERGLVLTEAPLPIISEKSQG